MIEPYFEAEGVTLYHADCLDVLRGMAAASVDAVVTDPPYNRVLDDAWDRQWADRDEFVNWLDGYAAEWARVLRANGSLWCFAYPHTAARVEVMLERRFHILNHITWEKPSGVASRSDKSALRAFLPMSERVIFAEHYGSDGYAMGGSGYNAACDDARGLIFEPLRAYIAGEVARAGETNKTVAAFCGVTDRMIAHYTGRIQWELPTRERYAQMQTFLNRSGGEYLRREYESLRREYESLRREYESLRRFFEVTADIPYTDVWRFNTSCQEGTLHPAQKPLALMAHILSTSTRPGALILDPFAGSGTTGVAAIQLGRRVILVEREREYCEIVRARLERALAQPRLFDAQMTAVEQERQGRMW